MGTVTTVAFSSRWRVPVYVGTGDLANTEITGPADAVRYMSENFQFKSGPHYRRALVLCHGALTNGVNPELSRAHFLAACADEAVNGDGKKDR